MKRWFIFLPVLAIIFTFTTSASAISNKPIHWGFKKGSKGKRADAGAEYEAFYKGNADDKILYLTFDNGYENGYTEKVLDILKEEQVPATFFVTGHYLRTAEKIAKRMVDEGHIIGNHSWSHPDLTEVSDEKLRRELELVEEETARITDQEYMVYLRPPRGIISERTLKLAKEEGYTHVLWSLAFKDWNIKAQKGASYAYDSIMKQVHPGAVILLHTVSKDNADALKKVIKDLKKDGYEFKSLDDYMLREKINNPLFQQ